MYIHIEFAIILAAKTFIRQIFLLKTCSRMLERNSKIFIHVYYIFYIAFKIFLKISNSNAKKYNRCSVKCIELYWLTLGKRSCDQPYLRQVKCLKMSIYLLNVTYLLDKTVKFNLT